MPRKKTDNCFCGAMFVQTISVNAAPEAVFQTLESEGDFNQPGAKLCAFYCRVVDNGKPPWGAWKEDTRFTDLYLLLTKKEKEGEKTVS